MKNIIFIFLFAAAAVFGGGAAAAESPDMAAVMRGMFLSQSGEHAQAARLFSRIGEKLQNAPLMGEAYRESLSAGAPHETLRYARRWQALGGGAEAVLAQARTLFALNRFDEAKEILAELKDNGELEDEELLQLLRFAPRGQITELGRGLFSDTANGNLLRAKLAALAGDYPEALEAVGRGLAREGAGAELHLLKARIIGRGTPGAVLEILTEYESQNCPGISSGCGEQPLLYAYSLYARQDENWRRALDNPAEEEYEAALEAGRFMERADLPARARAYYEKVRGRFFRADLGLARIARDAGQLQEALDILNAAAAADNAEFVLREVTAADVEKKLRGPEAAMRRIRRARLTSPDSFDLLYQHSLLAEQSGDIKEAVALLERLTELFPNAAEGWNALGYVLADHNLRLDDAEIYIKRALALEPDSANILDSLGWLYYRQGNLQEARRFLLAAVEKSDSAEIAAHLGEVYWHLGEREQAQAVFSKAQAHDPGNEVLNETLRRLQAGN